MNWSGSPCDDSVDVTVPSREALLEDIAARLAAGNGFSVATLNLDHVVKLRRDPVFRRAYAAHTHVTADGNPIVWLSRLSGRPVNLVPGSELVWPVLAMAAERGWPVALFGSDDETLDRAVRLISAELPALRIVFRCAPTMGFDPRGAEAHSAIEAIAASGAAICFVALGAPKQEIFVAEAQRDLPDRGFLSVGAGLDFIAGTQRRAPRFVRLLAAEWVWRLLSDPARLARRYGACLAILPRLAVEAIRAR